MTSAPVVQTGAAVLTVPTPRGWISKCLLAVADQGFLSGANFLVTLLLARWLPEEQYGAFALAMAGSLLAASVHQAVVLEPMTVLGPSRHAGHLRRYLGSVTWLHALFSLPLAGVFAAAALLAGAHGASLGVGGCAAAFAAAVPFTLLLSVARTASYLELRPGPATAAAIAYGLAMAGGLAWLIAAGRVTAPAAILLMGAVSSAVGCALLWYLRPAFEPRPVPRLRAIVRQHWRYGRWLLGVLLIGWAAQNLSYALAGGLLSLKGVAALRALMNMVLPVGTLLAAVNRLVLPYLSSRAGKGEVREFQRLALRIAGMYTAGATLLMLGPAIFHRRLFLLLYGGKYLEWSGLLPYILLWVAGYAAAQGFCAAFRARQRPSLVLLSECVASATFLSIGVLAVRPFGLAGLIGAGAAANLAVAAFAAFLFHRYLRVSE